MQQYYTQRTGGSVEIQKWLTANECSRETKVTSSYQQETTILKGKHNSCDVNMFIIILPSLYTSSLCNLINNQKSTEAQNKEQKVKWEQIYFCNKVATCCAHDLSLMWL